MDFNLSRQPIIVDFYRGSVHLGEAIYDSLTGWRCDILLMDGSLEKVEHQIFEVGNDYGYVYDNIQYVRRLKGP